ncbi:hypothetical protein [Sphingomonas sp. Leaf10]|uniref:hypothetical protein n=1 Tax=Sphingomonas sp. Leaf10 TaxID=1735676 RepID=UPI0006FF12CB|nr:hypothetical protein [Sphingomonas sp. Leaf10]KQM30130.1 hypothetical protein ASE59_09605 [Sphingomonas sp. Leaf10]
MDDAHKLLWTIAGVAAMLFAVAVLAERRRTLRRDPDRVGWMPWTLVQLMAVLVMVFGVAMAVK